MRPFFLSLWLNLLKRSVFLVTSLVLLAPTLFAANTIQITSIDARRASNVVIGDATTTPIVYGGIVGDVGAGACGGTLSASSTCNNCEAGAGPGMEFACNRRRIHPGLKLLINFKVVGDLTGVVHYGFDLGSGPQAFQGSGVDYTSSTGTTTITKDGVGSIEVFWGALCREAYLDDTCGWGIGEDGDNLTTFISVESGTATFDEAKRVNINISINGREEADVDSIICPGTSDGICTFTVEAGDEKVYIDNLALNGATCPAEFKFARVFYSTVDFDDASYTAQAADLPFNTNCTPKDEWIIEDLPNGVPHFFRISIVDIAQNNFFLTADPGCAFTSPTPTPGEDLACTTIATPGKVDGLLPDDYNCFIATAAYGTHFEKKLKTFRQFRRQVLLASQWGRQFVKFYYKYGPIGAKFMAGKENLRAVTRVALLPVWGVAWFSLHYGLTGTLLFILTLMSFVFFGVREWRRAQA